MNRSLDSVAAELDALARRGLGRTLRVMEPAGSARVRIREGRATREATNLCSNDYLGLAADPGPAAAAAAAAAAGGAGSGAARLVTGTRPIHEALESDVRRLTGAESALTFSSGYAGNLAVLGALFGPEDLVVSDALNHASLIDGIRLSGAVRRIVTHADAGAAREALRDRARFRRAAVVTEGLFSMEGDVAPLADLAAVARAADALLVVDDAHGTGVLGAGGGGALERAGVGPAPDVVRLGTFGKAFGASGAYVAGSADVCALVVHLGRGFVFSTAPAPPAVAAAREGLRLAYAEPGRRARCLGFAEEIADGLRRRGVDVPRVPGPILPVVLGDAERAVAASRRLLEEHGFLVAAIRPPTVPDGTARLRVSATAALDPGDGDRAAAALAAVLR